MPNHDPEPFDEELAEKPEHPLGIDPEAINRYLATQIMESLLGEKVREAIDATIKDLASPGGYGRSESPVMAFVRDEMHRLIRERIAEPDVQAMFREAVVNTLTPEKLQIIASSLEVSVPSRY